MSEAYPRTYADYLLLERLGSGGMSEVDLARKVVDDPSFVRFAVIKRIKADKSTDESFVRMFKDEARITSELHHEKIGTVYDFGKVGDEYYLALEYVPGVDVRYLVNVLRERGQRVPVRVALKILVDTLEALDYAHAKKDTFGRRMGIVHRDVNPRNVMVSIRGDVKLIDFGVAKATDRLEHTRTDHVKGKFAYMAPEQISGLPIDHRADLYAVGLMLHELLTGTSPFFGLNQVQILHRMLGGKPPPLPAVPEVGESPRLAAIHARALAAQPGDRYGTAGEMAADLRALAEELGGLPTADQLAAFLALVDPELTSRLQLKMEQYSRAERSQPIGMPARLESSSLPEVGQATFADQDSLTVTRIGVLGGSVLLVSMISAVLASVVVTALFVGGYLWFRDPGVARPEPTPIDGAPPEPPPAPVGTDPAPAPAPGAPAGVPAAGEPPREAAPVSAPGPRRPTPAPEPAGPPPSPEPVEAAPEPAPEPVPEPGPAEVAPAPAPAPAPPAPPAPTDQGFLNVTAPTHGLAVLVDGVEVGRTPLRLWRAPVGTHSVEVVGACTQTVKVVSKQPTHVLCR